MMCLLVDFPTRCSIILESADTAQGGGWDETQPVMVGEEEITICDEEEGPIPKDVTPDDISVFICHDDATSMNLIVDFPDDDTDNSSTTSSDTSSSSDADADAPRVTFAESPPQINLIEDLTITEHKPELWYTATDLDSFIRENNKNVTMIKILQRFGGRGSGDDDTMAKYAQQRLEQANTTPMGLESRLGVVSLTEMTMRREAHCEAVLEEQLRQREVGLGDAPDADAIADISREKSEWARNRANVIGNLHADVDCCSSILRAGVKKRDPVLPTPPSA